VAGVYVLLAGYDLISSSGEIGTNTVASAARPASAAVSRSTASPSSRARTAAPAPANHRTAAGQATDPLAVASITAFGPAGTSDGDNPGIAFRVLDVGTDQPWYSQWYATPDFGNLQPGTGLLLDLGSTMTVGDVELGLGPTPGADVEVRVGNSPDLDLPTAADAGDVGGNVRLTLTAPAKGRYVLVWFTRLPTDGHGHYQVSVYNVAVDG
jgi:hypothetical protein